MLVPVYDIVNCGKHKRFSANGKLVHNSDKINLQNLRSRGDTTLKQSIRAPKGYVFIDADSSQIEARTLAWIAGQQDVVTAFENREDVYVAMAAKIYDKEEAEISKSDRAIGKMVVLACGYGMGHVKFRSQLKATADVDLPESEVQHIIYTYRESNYKITELWRRTTSLLPSDEMMF